MNTQTITATSARKMSTAHIIRAIADLEQLLPTTRRGGRLAVTRRHFLTILRAEYLRRQMALAS